MREMWRLYPSFFQKCSMFKGESENEGAESSGEEMSNSEDDGRKDMSTDERIHYERFRAKRAEEKLKNLLRSVGAFLMCRSHVEFFNREI
jgi:hypothetical protein